MKRYLPILIVVLAAVIAAGEVSAQRASVSLDIGKGGVSKGKTSRAYVVMKIPNGLHVNSNKPRSEYSIPTRVRVSAEGATTGAVSYPAGKVKRFSFSDNPISVYEGRVVFPFSVSVPKGFSGSRLRIKAEVRYQACTDEVCYAPETETVYLNVVVK